MNIDLQEIIDDKVIENCALNGACDVGLEWLRRKPRTYADLRQLHKDWYNWLAQRSSLPAVLEKLAGDQYSYVRREAKRRLASLQEVA